MDKQSVPSADTHGEDYNGVLPSVSFSLDNRNDSDLNTDAKQLHLPHRTYDGGFGASMHKSCTSPAIITHRASGTSMFSLSQQTPPLTRHISLQRGNSKRRSTSTAGVFEHSGRLERKTSTRQISNANSLKIAVSKAAITSIGNEINFKQSYQRSYSRDLIFVRQRSSELDLTTTGDLPGIHIARLVSTTSTTKPGTAADEPEPLGHLSKCQRYGILTAVVLVTLFGRAQKTLISPFYPNYAVERNVTELGIGFVFGSLDFATLGSCLIWGKVLHFVNVKYVYTAGIIGTSVFSGLFSVLYVVRQSSAFLGISIALRVLMGFFSGAYYISESALLVSLFPNHVASIMGAIEASASIGFLTGPVIGGALYQFGGFYVPFIVMSAVILITGLSILCTVPSAHTTEKTEVQARQMMAIPVFTGCLGFQLVVSATWAMTFALFSLHLEEYDMNPLQRSGIIMISSIFYIIFSVTTGRVIDKKPSCTIFLIIGAFSLFGLFETLFGPAPYYNITMSPLWLLAMCWGLLGLTGSIGVIASVTLAYSTVKEAGYPDALETYGLVAGFLKSTEALGSGLGSIIGGVVYSAFGWQWMQTGMGYVMGLQIVLYSMAELWAHKERKQSVEPVNQSDPKDPEVTHL